VLLIFIVFLMISDSLFSVILDLKALRFISIG
jgi:hypothetical protein